MNELTEYEEKIKQLTKQLDDLENNYPKLLSSYLRSYQNHLIQILPYITIPDNDDFYMEPIESECKGNNTPCYKNTNTKQEYEKLSFDVTGNKDNSKKQRCKNKSNDCFKYKIYSDKSGIEITGLLNQNNKITIPSTIDYLPVLSIGNSVFENSDITAIDFPNTIKMLGKRTFAGCKNLRTVSLPDSLEEIDEECFSESGLIEIKVNVEEIPNRCFFNCRNMKTVELGDKTVYIGAESFNGTAIQEVVIPKNVRYIYKDALVFATDNQNSVCIKSICFIGESCNIHVNDNACNLELTVYCLPGSQAQRWARSKGAFVRPVDDYLYDKDIMDIF